MRSDNLSTKYKCDFMMSVGPHCRPALHLRYNNMRDFSSPLDWMMNYSLETVLHLFRTKFEDFFIYIDEDETKIGTAGGMRWIEDSLNHIVSIHHFPVSLPIDDSKILFAMEMKKRVDRIVSLLNNSQSIVLITERNESQKTLTCFLRSFSAIYPGKKIRLVNLRNDEKMDFDKYKKSILLDKGDLSYLEYSLNDTIQGIRDPEGNAFVWGKILSEYETNRSRLKNEEWRTFRDNNHTIVVYGAGKRCIRILNWFSHMNIVLDGIAVTSTDDNPSQIDGKEVRVYCDYPKDTAFIIGIEDKKESIKIRNKLLDEGYSNVSFLDINMDRCSDLTN